MPHRPATPRPLGQTPSQTVGPYFSMALGRPSDRIVADSDTPGSRLHLTGVVRDGNGAVVEDALIELWQANADGRYFHPADLWSDRAPNFTGFGRSGTDHGTGRWWFTTIRPGRVPDDTGGLQAPHLNLVVQSRGMLNAVFTRVYFGDDPTNEADPVLVSVPIARRDTLIATPSRDSDASTASENHAEEAEAAWPPDDGLPVWYFDIVLQGPSETVFLDV